MNKQQSLHQRHSLEHIKLAQDPFLWHVNQHFSGILSKVNQLQPQTLGQSLQTIAHKIKQLNQQGAFELTESNIRIIFLQRLQDHLLKKMAFLISEDTDMDRDSANFQLLSPNNPNYFDNLQNYFRYNSKIHFAHILNCISPGLENPSLGALTHAVDICFFGEITDPFWQNHLEYSILSTIQNSLFQANNFTWLKNVIGNKIPQHSNLLRGFNRKTDPTSIRIMQKYDLQSEIEKILQEDFRFTFEHIKRANPALVVHENKKPGFFITVLAALHREKIHYLSKTYDETITKNHIKEIEQCVITFGLQPAMEAFKQSNALKLRIELDTKLKKTIKAIHNTSIEYPDQVDKFRLKLYGEKLIAREQHTIAQTPQQDIKLFFAERFHTLTNPLQLIDVSGGNDQLCWLAHQYAEYEMAVWEDVLAAINFDELDLDEDILAYVMHTTFLHHFFVPEDITQPQFITKTFDHFVNNLLQNQDEPNNDHFKLPSIPVLVEKIKKNFVSLLNNKQVSDLHARFNEAYHQHNWLEMQRLWAVFSKFQRMLLSTEQYKTKFSKFPKYRAPKKGDDYYFGEDQYSMPTDYDDLLNRAWSCYTNHSVNHYIRIHPSHSTTTLIYSSHKNPNKTAKLDISQLLLALKTTGTAIEEALANVNNETGKSTNIITAAICFVVSVEHKRIIIPVNLELLQNTILLSKDYQDAVYNLANEDEKNSYLKQMANSHYQSGMRALGKNDTADISTKHNSLLYHSEHVLIELLNKPESAEKIVHLLKIALEKMQECQLQTHSYKVYATALLMYSKNSICDICTPSLIALQNSHQAGGFLYNLQNALNANTSPFKTSQSQIPLLSIVIAAKPWSPQAHEFAESTPETPKDSKVMANPKSHLHFHKNCIELHPAKPEALLKSSKQFNSIIEFVNPKFPASPGAKIPFCFSGNVFMSGSKQEKFNERSTEVDERARSIIKGLAI